MVRPVTVGRAFYSKCSTESVKAPRKLPRQSPPSGREGPRFACTSRWATDLAYPQEMEHFNKSTPKERSPTGKKKLAAFWPLVAKVSGSNTTIFYPIRSTISNERARFFFYLITSLYRPFERKMGGGGGGGRGALLIHRACHIDTCIGRKSPYKTKKNTAGTVRYAGGFAGPCFFSRG